MLTEEQRELIEKHHHLIEWYIKKRHLDPSEYYDLFAIALVKSVMADNFRFASIFGAH